MNDSSHISKYSGIINLPHHVSSTRPQMSMHDRAAQFSPFAALTGHAAAIRETARLTLEETELDDGMIEAINKNLRWLKTHLSKSPMAEITYFKEDELKSGGAYMTASAIVRKMDDLAKTIVLDDGTVIPMKHIVRISLFQSQ